VPDAYLQPPPLFKSVAAVPGRGSTVTTFQISYEPPIAPRDQNRYWQEFEQRLGVKLEPTLTPAGSYAEKLAALTASGDLADLTCVILANEPGQYRVLQQGGYADLTPALTGDALKEYPNLALFPEKVWKNVALNGKVYGIPRANFAAGGALLWRQDWAAKFRAPKPKNADEFFALMTAFTGGDPDGNGQADSYGISSFGNNTFANGFFQQVFLVPNTWRRNPDGSLTAAVETEEFKGALAFMRRIFEAGLYHPNTATMTNNQAKDNFQAGRFGGYTDGITALPGASGMRARVKQVTPTAEAVGLVPFGHDGGPGVTHAGAGFFGFVSLAAKAGRDRERLRELLRVVNYWGAPFGSEEDRFVGSGVEGVHYTVKPDGTTARTEQANKDLGSFPNLVVAPPVFYYPDAPGDAVYMQGLVRDLIAINLENPTLDSYAPTAVSKAGELSRLQADRIGAVVQGREPLSAWDQFVRDWRGRGGDQIRTEYEEALKSR
jgi:putative aldouronate transport system substrate-binding protein